MKKFCVWFGLLMSTAVFTACGTGIKNSSERSNSSVSMQTQNINIEIENLVDVYKRQILQNALQSLRAAQTEGANSKGQTAQAIYDKSQELINQIQRLDNNLEETTNYIRHVLAVYKAKDEMLKAIMALSLIHIWTGYREHRSGLCKTGRNNGNGCYRKSWMWKEHNASENRADGIGSG